MTEAATGTRRTITAFFDEREPAARAVENLVEAGLPRASVRLVPGNEQSSTASRTEPAETESFWETLKEFFLPDEDRSTYAEGLRRGGYLVTASIAGANYEEALQILDAEGTIDIDERAESWRKEGWMGYAPGAGAGAVKREQRIPLVEEQLKVGKREVEQGRVRVRSYVTEAPVTEQVNLRQEQVTIERRPTDRSLTGADDAFRERTIEAEETREEAVVAKEARVKEEVVLRKDVQDTTKTVSDTVRRTDVEVEDERTAGPTQKTPGARRE